MPRALRRAQKSGAGTRTHFFTTFSLFGATREGEIYGRNHRSRPKSASLRCTASSSAIVTFIEVNLRRPGALPATDVATLPKCSMAMTCFRVLTHLNEGEVIPGQLRFCFSKELHEFPPSTARTEATRVFLCDEELLDHSRLYFGHHCSFHSAIQMLPVRSPMLNTNLLPPIAIACST